MPKQRPVAPLAVTGMLAKINEHACYFKIIVQDANGVEWQADNLGAFNHSLVRYGSVNNGPEWDYWEIKPRDETWMNE